MRLVVAFTGQDGTGKSTQIALLRDRLVAEGRSVEVVHQYEPITAVGRGVSPWAKRAANRFMRRVAGPAGAATARSAALPVRVAARAAASISLLAGWRRSRRNLRCGRGRDVLILDRCYSDEIIRAAHKFGRAPGIGRWLLQNALPAPDLVFSFTVKERVGWERKKTRELTPEEYAQKAAVVRETLRELGQTWDIMTIAVDALEPAGVFERVWSRVRSALESPG